MFLDIVLGKCTGIIIVNDLQFCDALVLILSISIFDFAASTYVIFQYVPTHFYASPWKNLSEWIKKSTNTKV